MRRHPRRHPPSTYSTVSDSDRVPISNDASAEMKHKSNDGTIWITEDRPCPVCKSEKFKFIGTRGGASHRAGKGVETNIVRCRICDIVYTRPTLVPESNPYEKETPDQYFQKHVSQNKIKSGESLAAYAESKLGKPGRMLELGCGRGENLIGAKNRGWDVYGVEMTDSFAKLARSNGIVIDQNPIRTSGLLKEQYDVILLAAILEHLYDPVETLEKVAKALAKNGLLFIDVPNESSLAMHFGNFYMKFRGRPWSINLSPTFPPFHVVGFSPKSLKLLLENKGFKILDISIPKWANDSPKGHILIDVVEHAAFGVIQSFGALIGMGDGITCWAVKA